MVAGVRLYAPHVWLRLRALHRARRQPAFARGRPGQSSRLPQSDRGQRATRGPLVGVSGLFGRRRGADSQFAAPSLVSALNRDAGRLAGVY